MTKTDRTVMQQALDALFSVRNDDGELTRPQLDATIAALQSRLATPPADPRKQALDDMVRHSEELGLYDMPAEPAADEIPYKATLLFNHETRTVEGVMKVPAAAPQSGPINYFAVQEAAAEFKLDYNALCAAVRKLAASQATEQPTNAVAAEREACARVCETHPLTLEHQRHSMETLHDMAVAEAGCRGAFADAIRGRGHEQPADRAQRDELPPLPEPAVTSYQIDSVMRSHELHTYTAGQMRERDAMWEERLRAALQRKGG